MSTIGSFEIGRLVAGAYDAALDSARWPEFLQMAASTFRADTGVIWTHDFQNSKADFDSSGANLSAFVGFDASSLSVYADHYSHRNVWAANEAGMPEGKTVTSSMLYPDTLLPNTEFYNDWLRPLDLFYSLGSIVVKRETRGVKMSFLRSARAGCYASHELKVFDQLMPHLQSAVTLHRKLHHLQALSSAAMAALDAIAHGVILLKCDGSFLHANHLAHDLLIKPGTLKISGSGAVHATAASSDAILQLLIRRAVKTGTGSGVKPGGALSLTSSANSTVQAMVVPLPARSSPFGEHVSAAIFCSDLESGFAGNRCLAEALERTYQMTQSEALLTQALVNGQSLKEFARSRQVSINTVRSQLRAATAKTEAKRQADLVRIVLTGPAVLMSRRSAKVV